MLNQNTCEKVQKTTKSSLFEVDKQEMHAE